MNHSQKLYEDSKLVCQLVVTHEEKLVSLSPIMLDDNLKTTSVSFFIADFNLLSCEFDSLTFKLLYCVILYG